MTFLMQCYKDQISKEDDAEFANFAETSGAVHLSGSTVTNLSNLFLQEFFTKFKRINV